MSNITKLKYILTPDFNRRLLMKDISNVDKVIPSNTAANKSKVLLTTPITKILSPLVRFNHSDILQISLEPVSPFQVYQLDTKGVEPKISHLKLSWSHGSEFTKWLKMNDSKITHPLKEIDNKEDFVINLNNTNLEEFLIEIIESNSLEKLNGFLEENREDTRSMTLLLQHLKQDQHEIFQQVCQHAIEHSLMSLSKPILSCLLKLTENEASYNIFTENFLRENETFDEKFIDNLVALNIKYSKLTRAKTFIDLLLRDELLPTKLENYISALSFKLAKSTKNDTQTFTLLTSGLEQALCQKITPDIVRAFIPFLKDIHEYTSLLSIIDQSSEQHHVYTEVLNELTREFHGLLMRTEGLSDSKRRAVFTFFMKHLASSSVGFENCIDIELLLLLYIQQENWHSAYDLLKRKFPHNRETRSKVIKIAENRKIPKFVETLFL